MGCVPSTERVKIEEPHPETFTLASGKGKANPRQHGLPSLSAAAMAKVPLKDVYGDGIGHARFILDQPGKITDFYDFDVKIGQGAYGAVRKATHTVQQQVRAIKTIAKKRMSTDAKQVDRLKKEIAIMKRMDHPGIVRLYETFEDESNVYLVMELCSGGELFDRIVNAKHFTERCAAGVMQQILRAVFYMHEAGIVHRDLKPENFLLLNKKAVDNNVIKIIDFGLSTRWSPGQLLTTKVGTPYYVAPQVLAGSYDNLCDLWSCGVIMYILLCGYPPFTGQNDKEVFAKIRAGHVHFPHSDWRFISTDAQDLIELMVKVNPRERLNSEQALKHSWIKSEAPVTPRASLRPAFLDNLRSFRSQNKLKKAALHIIAGRLSEERIKGLRETFVSLDENQDGLLTITELKSGLEHSGLKVKAEDLQAIVDGLDGDGSGYIDYSEFLAATLDRRTLLTEAICQSAFSIFDLNNDGRITLEEVKQVLAVDGASEASCIESAASIIKELDKDGDGSVDFQEFMAMMHDAP